MRAYIQHGYQLASYVYLNPSFSTIPLDLHV